MVTQMADDPAIMESMIAQNPQLQQAFQVMTVGSEHPDRWGIFFSCFLFRMSGFKVSAS